MNSFKSTMMKVLLVLFGLGLAILAGCGGKSSGASTSTPTATVKITGTAAMGAPLAGAAVTIKDSAGMTKTGTAGATGAYSIDVTGLTPPYLVKVDHLGIHILYSVGTAAGVINTHPLTDLIIRTWYKVQGTDVATEFAKTTPAAPPTAIELGVIKQVVKNLVAQFLGLLGNIDSTSFDLISTPFTANSTGFDHVLDNINVNAASGVIAINTVSGVGTAPEYQATLAVSGTAMTSTLAQDLANSGTFTTVSTASNTIAGITASPYAGVWSLGHTATSSLGNCGTQVLNVPRPPIAIVVDSNGNFLLPDIDKLGNFTGYIQGMGNITSGGNLTATLYGDTVAPYIGGACPAGTMTGTMTDVNTGAGTFVQDGGGTFTLTRVTTAFNGTYAASSAGTQGGAVGPIGTFTVTNGVVTGTINVFSGTVSASGAITASATSTTGCDATFTGQISLTASGGATATGTFVLIGLDRPTGGTCSGGAAWTATRQ